MAGPLDRAFVEITAELDTRQAQRAANTAGRAVENELTDGVRRAEQSMARQAARAGEIVGETIADTASEALGEGLRRNASGRIVDAQGRFVSAARASGEAVGEALADSIGEGLEEGLRRDVNGRLRDQFGRFVDDGGRGGRRTGTAFGDGFGQGLSATLSSIAGIRLPVGGFVVFGGALAAAAASAVQLAAALAPAVGIVAGLPSVIGVAAAGMTTLNVATLGVGDAFEAAFGEAEEFEEAMEGLAPNVQEAAQALRDMAPQLDALRDRVQDAFFQDFDDVLNSLADTLMGPVSDGMTAVASEMNGIIQMLTGVATSAEGVDFVTQSFEIMAGILSRLQEPLTLLFSSLLNVGTAINEAFGEDAGAGLADLITRFAAFLDQAAASGQAVQWIENAMAVFSAIGDILSPIVGIFGSIGAAASQTGGNILGVFGQVLQVFDDFLSSVEGQAVLVTVFEALNSVGASFGTVLKGIAPALPPIISGISDILSVVSPLLGPLSQLVGSVLAALAPILRVVASAIQPIIGPLTEIVELLGPILVDAITTLMPVVEFLADLLGGALGVAIELVSAVLGALAPVITVVLDALEPLIEALEPLFELLGVVADLIGSVLEPIIQALGAILLWLVETVIVPLVIPVVELLAQILTLVLGAAVDWLVEKFELAGQGIAVVWNFIKDTIVQHAEDIAAGWDTLVAVFQLGWRVLNDRVFTPVKNAFSTVKNVAVAQIGLIESGFGGFVSFVRGIPRKISGALGSMFDPLWSGFKSAINAVIRGWNNLSFSVPSVDLGPLGEVGGITVSTPNIPYLARGGLTTGPTLAMVGEAGTEAVLPLEDRRTEALLGRAIQAALSGMGTDTGGIGQSGEAPNVFVTVRIGERELDAMIDTRIDSNNQQMLRRARAGTRRNH